MQFPLWLPTSNAPRVEIGGENFTTNHEHQRTFYSFYDRRRQQQREHIATRESREENFTKHSRRQPKNALSWIERRRGWKINICLLWCGWLIRRSFLAAFLAQHTIGGNSFFPEKNNYSIFIIRYLLVISDQTSLSRTVLTINSQAIVRQGMSVPNASFYEGALISSCHTAIY